MTPFERDLNSLSERLTQQSSNVVSRKLLDLRDTLISLRMDNLVKINHSVMELVCANYLISAGYDVELEHPLKNGLICDLYAVKGYGNLIVEIETGFIPPKHALDPMTYSRARIASKIIRYGNFADKFALGTPLHYIMQIPPVMTKPPRHREISELKKVKDMCDIYYESPPVTLDEIRNTRLHAIYIIDVDEVKVLEMDPDAYIQQYFNKRS